MSDARRWLVITVVSFSGGIIYMLPFLQEVYYLPLASALDLDNTQVGSLMSVFGLASLLTYFPGGWLADRVSPRLLMTLSLFCTGVLGLWFATFPGYLISLAIHALWGVSITFLFWGAMIRVTRFSAPSADQGKAFGLLETGRGLGELLPALGLLAVFAALGSSTLALSLVISLYSLAYLLLALLTWFVLSDSDSSSRGGAGSTRIGWEEILNVLRMPVVWLITVVVWTGYCAYWGLFRFTPYATEVFALSVTVGAAISVGKMWLKPMAALVAGFAADRIGIARSVICLFAVLVAAYAAIAALPGTGAMVTIMLALLTVASVAVFAMRGIYFALLEEGRVPLAVTGTAAGIISALAFTPDIFMPLMGGWLIDRYPGPDGYRYFFTAVATICVLGLSAALVIHFRFARRVTGGKEE